jgi:uncharacterized protein HemY
LGQIYAKDRRWSEATAQLSAAAQMRPGLSADDCYQIAYSAWEAGQPDKVQEFLSKGLSIDPRHGDVLALAALFRQGQSATSQTAYSPPPLPAPKGWEESQANGVIPQ